jgi:hypothetical protein
LKRPNPKPAGAKAIGDKLLYELSYKVTRNLPPDLQNLQVEMCDHAGAKYPNSSCQGVRDAIVDSKWR